MRRWPCRSRLIPTERSITVRAWLVKKKRFHMHYTPNWAPLPNQVARRSRILSRRATERSTFWRVTDLRQGLLEFTEEYNETAKPFAWVATADSIFEELDRLCARI